MIVPHFENLSVNIAFGNIQFVTHDGRMQQGLDSIGKAPKLAFGKNKCEDQRTNGFLEVLV